MRIGVGAIIVPKSKGNSALYNANRFVNCVLNVPMSKLPTKYVPLLAVLKPLGKLIGPPLGPLIEFAVMEAKVTLSPVLRLWLKGLPGALPTTLIKILVLVCATVTVFSELTTLTALLVLLNTNSAGLATVAVKLYATVVTVNENALTCLSQCNYQRELDLLGSHLAPMIV